jgi:uncharacterized membrane protein YfhO
MTQRTKRTGGKLASTALNLPGVLYVVLVPLVLYVLFFLPGSSLHFSFKRIFPLHPQEHPQ